MNEIESQLKDKAEKNIEGIYTHFKKLKYDTGLFQI